MGRAIWEKPLESLAWEDAAHLQRRRGSDINLDAPTLTLTYTSTPRTALSSSTPSVVASSTKQKPRETPPPPHMVVDVRGQTTSSPRLPQRPSRF
jgi:hypothetical protein